MCAVSLAVSYAEVLLFNMKAKKKSVDFWAPTILLLSKGKGGEDQGKLKVYESGAVKF